MQSVKLCFLYGRRILTHYITQSGELKDTHHLKAYSVMEQMHSTYIQWSPSYYYRVFSLFHKILLISEGLIHSQPPLNQRTCFFFFNVYMFCFFQNTQLETIQYIAFSLASFSNMYLASFMFFLCLFCFHLFSKSQIMIPFLRNDVLFVHSPVVRCYCLSFGNHE